MEAIPGIGPPPTIRTLSPYLLQFTPTPTLRFRFRFAPTRTVKSRRVSCSKDELLAAELGLEIKKLNTQIAQREDAFKKSRELLFAEMSDFAGLKSEDLKKKWRRMNDGEKWVLVKGFVAEWSKHFHPLSARSIKELVEEHVSVSHDDFSESVSANLLPDFRKLFGIHG